jgi:hypothetical protein
MAASVCILALLTAACGINPPPASIQVHTEPIPHIGINGLMYGQYLPAQLAPICQSSKALTVRAPVRSVAEANTLLAGITPCGNLSALLLVEKPDLGLVASLLNVKDHPLVIGIELTNEPELQGLTAQQFGAFVIAAQRQLLDGGWTKDILSGGLYTVDADTVQYLRDANLALMCHAWHFYGEWSDAILAMIQSTGSCWALTETGAPSTDAASDAYQLQYLTQGLVMAQRGGARYVTPYQLLSGPCGDTSNLGNFGLLRCDLSQKPAFSLLQ